MKNLEKYTKNRKTPVTIFPNAFDLAIPHIETEKKNFIFGDIFMHKNPSVILGILNSQKARIGRIAAIIFYKK